MGSLSCQHNKMGFKNPGGFKILWVLRQMPRNMDDNTDNNMEEINIALKRQWSRKCSRAVCFSASRKKLTNK